MARPVVHGLRNEYQDRVNFVILDYDEGDELGLARDLGVAQHPAYALVAPDSDDVVSRVFGPQRENDLRSLLDGLIARFAG
jgi:hypothetical protein